MAVQISFKPKEVTKKLLKAIPERSAEILARRYGLGKSVKHETLESVGRTFGITRERVRQIENGALNVIRQSSAYKEQGSVFIEIAGVIHDFGAIVSEEKLLTAISNNESTQNHVHFLLVVGNGFIRAKEDTLFVHRWYENPDIAKRVQAAMIKIYKSMSRDQLIAERDLIDSLLTQVGEVDALHKNDNIARNWLSLSKGLAKNPLGDWGRIGSPGVNLRGVRDMAWLILRRSGSPMHYTEVTKEIEKAFGRKAHSATCHNELIKDPRFVLVGRGLYALSEWGYTAGIVKEVIKNILINEGPLTKAELIDRVKRERYVKTNTISVNLQDYATFGMDEKNRYYVKKEVA